MRVYVQLTARSVFVCMHSGTCSAAIFCLQCCNLHGT
jgi:hypothetical protein